MRKLENTHSGRRRAEIQRTVVERSILGMFKRSFTSFRMTKSHLEVQYVYNIMPLTL
ncbi:hypothetical protein AQULUS_08830 [Aquicella lusitana]|uniref:Uncharacterized protein n=1 Tax=Aquicella lusitana TaxID=254246 RepID=A0A370H3U8_9COXI|nr:hypothetical protein C8D86_1011 [Aquicella lusitana]VVC73152.1 hypothetical protein AQULUS_08830 [Aquicella lusitana]